MISTHEGLDGDGKILSQSLEDAVISSSYAAQVIMDS